MDLRHDRKANLQEFSSDMDDAVEAAKAGEVIETDYGALNDLVGNLFRAKSLRAVWDATGAPAGVDVAIANKWLMIAGFQVQQASEACDRAIRAAQKRCGEMLDKVPDLDPDEKYRAVQTAQLELVTRIQSAEALMHSRQKAAATMKSLMADGVAKVAKIRRDSDLMSKPNIFIIAGADKGRDAFQLPVSADDAEIVDES